MLVNDVVINRDCIVFLRALVTTLLFGNKIGFLQVVGFVTITVGVYYYKNYGKEIKPDEYQKINYKTGGDPDEFDLEMADRRESPRN
mmetsp:Transcript_9428/g.7864  ORF Transcript_9428/g.7864 Transcript_9428/m.7864 type:complete len:87 (-) Transcript_9428:114-374(-)